MIPLSWTLAAGAGVISAVVGACTGWQWRDGHAAREDTQRIAAAADDAHERRRLGDTSNRVEDGADASTIVDRGLVRLAKLDKGVAWVGAEAPDDAVPVVRRRKDDTQRTVDLTVNRGTKVERVAVVKPPPPSLPPPPPFAVPAPFSPSLVPAEAWTGSQPWTAGFMFGYGEVPAGTSIGVAGQAIQVDVRSRYPDGSLQFAVLSGDTPSSTLTITQGAAAASGANVAEPAVAVTVAFSGVVDAAGSAVAGGSFSADIATARAAGAGAWSRTQARLVRSILGPVMSEFHYYVPTADAHVAVWFYVRAYAAGRVEVETVVENGWTMVAGPGRRDYTATVTVGGTQRYSAAIRHYHHAQWSRVDWIGGESQATVRQSARHAGTTGIWPSTPIQRLNAAAYTQRPEHGPKFATYTRELASRTAPFDLANFDPQMGAGGISDGIGLFGPWDMTWLVEGDVRAAWAIEANARAIGRYSLHYRDETTGRPVRVSRNTTLGISDVDVGYGSNPGNHPILTPASAGGRAPGALFNRTHAPSPRFSAYLLTGRWQFQEGLVFEAVIEQMRSSMGWMHQGHRIERGSVQLREWAWGIRTIAQSAIATPQRINDVPIAGADADSRSEVIGLLNSTYDYYARSYVDGEVIGAPWNWYYRQFANNPFGLFWAPGYSVAPEGGTGTGHLNVGMMMQAFAAQVLCWAAQTRAFASTDVLRLGAFAARWPVGLLGHGAGNTDWDGRFISGYIIPAGTVTWARGEITSISVDASWNALWARVNSGNWAGPTLAQTAKNSAMYRMHDMQREPYRPPDKLPSVDKQGGSDTAAFPAMLAMAHNVSKLAAVSGDADAALFRFGASPTWHATIRAAMRDDPTYGYVARDAMPDFLLPAAGEAKVIGLNTPLDVAPAGWGSGDFRRSYADSFGGGTFVSRYGAMGAYAMGPTGGHAHPDLIHDVIFDVKTRSHVLLSVANTVADKQSVPYAIGDTTGWPNYEIKGSQVPAPPHPYQMLAYWPKGRKGSVIYTGRSAVTSLSVTARTSHAQDLDTRTWSRVSNHLLNGDGETLSDVRVGPETSVVWDDERWRWWVVSSGPHNFTTQLYLDAHDMKWRETPEFARAVPGAIASFARVMPHDGKLIRNGGLSGLWMFDPDAPRDGWFQLSVSGTLPIGQDAWVRHRNGKWYAYSGRTPGAENVIARITPPSDARSGTWVVDTVTLSVGSLPLTVGYTTEPAAYAHYTRLFHIPALDLIGWSAGATVPVVAFDPE